MWRRGSPDGSQVILPCRNDKIDVSSGEALAGWVDFPRSSWSPVRLSRVQASFAAAKLSFLAGTKSQRDSHWSCE